MTGWNRKNASDGSVAGNIDWNATKTATKYLPKGTDWYDFWTGQRMKGGQTVTLQTRLDRVPMFVRAGSILPLAPEMQYTGQQAWDNLELRLYPGKDATFTLYEDEGDNYNYEQGQYTEIVFGWNDKTRTLTIAPRKGSYKGMLQSRRFVVVLPGQEASAGTIIDYQGQEVSIRL